MKQLVDALNIAELVMFVGLALITWLSWRQRGGAARAWVALTFGDLGLVVAVGRALPKGETTGAALWATKLLIAVLVLFPYLLYRFASTFRRPSRVVNVIAVVMTAASVVGVFLLSRLPQPGDPRSSGFLVYLVLIVAQWVFLLGYVAGSLWRAGRGQPTVTRRRMRVLSVGAGTMALAIVISGASPSTKDPGVTQLVIALITLATAPLFALGLSPPRLVLATWRRREELELREAERGLMAALSPADIAGVLLPHVARVLGGSGAVLTASDGAVIGSFGVSPARAAAIVTSAVSPDGAADGQAVLTLPLSDGWLSVEASEYTPYFGREETEILRNLASLTDVALARARLSERERQVTEELRLANQSMREFVAIASHDLRTPITVIKGFAETLLGQWSGIADGDKLHYLSMVDRQADHLARLVDDLLTVSRIDAHAVVPDRRSVAVGAVAASIVSELGLEADVAIHATDDAVVDADPEHVVRIIRNYVENARNYGQLPIEVRTEVATSWVDIRVIDHGEGIPTEFAERLFERFARADKAKSKEKRGTGLGLSIVRGLAEAGGGSAWYDPAYDRTCFVVRLPRAGTAGVAGQPAGDEIRSR